MIPKRKILIAVLLVACVVSFVYEAIRRGESSGEAEQERGQVLASVYGYYIITEQGIRSGPYSQCDFTDAYVYFAYSQASFVDAYDMEGNFAFCICVEDRENAAMSIRCEGNQLYIKSKKGNVYIFEEGICIESIPSEEARENGYVDGWFRNKETPLISDQNYLYLQDTEGNKTVLIEKPQQVKYGEISLFIPVVFLGAALGLKAFSVRKERHDGALK